MRLLFLLVSVLLTNTAVAGTSSQAELAAIAAGPAQMCAGEVEHAFTLLWIEPERVGNTVMLNLWGGRDTADVEGPEPPQGWKKYKVPVVNGTFMSPNNARYTIDFVQKGKIGGKVSSADDRGQWNWQVLCHAAATRH